MRQFVRISYRRYASPNGKANASPALALVAERFRPLAQNPGPDCCRLSNRWTPSATSPKIVVGIDSGRAHNMRRTVTGPKPANAQLCRWHPRTAPTPSLEATAHHLLAGVALDGFTPTRRQTFWLGLLNEMGRKLFTSVSSRMREKTTPLGSIKQAPTLVLDRFRRFSDHDLFACIHRVTKCRRKPAGLDPDAYAAIGFRRGPICP